MRSVSSLLIVSLVLVFGCQVAHEPGHAGIAWHDGDVTGAFRVAEAEDKPLFLYWGAVWCPPCNQVKTTIFKRPAFVEKSQSFIPVYLDGDTESAQSWADRFEVQGYPTMIVFDPQGNEITRISAGIDIEAFASVLDVALARMKPATEVLAAAIDSSREVTDEDYRLLAYHSWEQDDDIGIAEEKRLEAFRTVAARVPESLPIERSRLYVTYLMQALEAEHAEDATPVLSDDERREAVERVRAILESSELLQANMIFAEYYAGEVVAGLLPEESDVRRELADAWLAAMESVRDDETLSTAERLRSWRPALDLHALRYEGEEVPEDLVEGIRKTVAWVDEQTTDAQVRQAVVSTAAHLLDDAGLQDEARALLLAEVETSSAPYYFMAGLSDLAEAAGNSTEAIEWLRKAHASSEGRATRFQWGTYYVLGLIELSPEEAGRIETESVKVLSELLALDDAFSGRNKRRLKQLHEKLTEWNADGSHDRRLATIRDTVQGSCASFPAESTARATCDGFLSRS